jgi:hypothetical protein
VIDALQWHQPGPHAGQRIGVFNDYELDPGSSDQAI